ncbi:DnaB-like helicase C-terminal domain-containing protein [Catellatospora sichuanensis]|uniref:DnaB-like helicase C-terminal domain-containing protein n=1 Tax=Catellatospora sichuanensis TaxID=1969805 RepID=UPI00164331E4|nr:DnaB-like helicase C-terminal domain-containing protein [Catellatospora sichuanensis]
MLTLTRAKHTKGAAGEPIPTVFQTLAAESVHVRRGQFTLIAAAPGVGKSVFALSLVLKAEVPSFYFSADTDAFTMYLRAGAMFTGYRTVDIEHAVEHKNTQQIDALLEKKSHCRFDFSGSIEIDMLEEELKAYAATYGEWPHVIVIDNLSNMRLDDAPEGYQALEAACDYLHELARETGAAVIALHHVTGTFDDGITAVPLSGLRGKVSKVPEMVLTLHRDASVGTDEMGTMYVTPVKNRTGKADPSGSWSLPLKYAPPTMTLEDRVHA